MTAAAANKTRFFYAVDYFPTDYGQDPDIKAFHTAGERDAWVVCGNRRFGKTGAEADALVKRYLAQDGTARAAALRGMI